MELNDVKNKFIMWQENSFFQEIKAMTIEQLLQEEYTGKEDEIQTLVDNGFPLFDDAEKAERIGNMMDYGYDGRDLECKDYEYKMNQYEQKMGYHMYDSGCLKNAEKFKNEYMNNLKQNGALENINYNFKMYMEMFDKGIIPTSRQFEETLQGKSDEGLGFGQENKAQKYIIAKDITLDNAIGEVIPVDEFLNKFNNKEAIENAFEEYGFPMFEEEQMANQVAYLLDKGNNYYDIDQTYREYEIKAKQFQENLSKAYPDKTYRIGEYAKDFEAKIRNEAKASTKEEFNASNYSTMFASMIDDVIMTNSKDEIGEEEIAKRFSGIGDKYIVTHTTEGIKPVTLRSIAIDNKTSKETLIKIVDLKHPVIQSKDTAEMVASSADSTNKSVSCRHYEECIKDFGSNMYNGLPADKCTELKKHFENFGKQYTESTGKPMTMYEIWESAGDALSKGITKEKENKKDIEIQKAVAVTSSRVSYDDKDDGYSK